jgi:hypothetical protein
MYIYQEGKLYVQDGEFLVGVNVTPSGSYLLEKERVKKSDKYSILTPSEVQAKFGIVRGETYEFPVKKKEVVPEPKVEVVTDEPVRKTKTTTRKSTRK